MDYESFFSDYTPHAKEMKDAAALVAKLQKLVDKDIAKGDTKAAAKDMAALRKAIENASASAQALEESISSFDSKDYFTSGEFACQLVTHFAQIGVDIVGDAPVYEVFPYKLRIDAENQDIYLNRKKFSTSRPSYIADLVKAELDKLQAASFNAQKFASELEKGYDICIALQSKVQAGSPIMLKNIYSALVPIARLKSGYPEQAFAYDIARLYSVADSVELKSGHKIEFGTERANAASYRILDANGREQFLGSVRFY